MYPQHFHFEPNTATAGGGGGGGLNLYQTIPVVTLGKIIKLYNDSANHILLCLLLWK